MLRAYRMYLKVQRRKRLRKAVDKFRNDRRLFTADLKILAKVQPILSLMYFPIALATWTCGVFLCCTAVLMGVADR